MCPPLPKSLRTVQLFAQPAGQSPAVCPLRLELALIRARVTGLKEAIA